MFYRKRISEEQLLIRRGQKGGRKDFNNPTEKQIFWKQQEDVTCELGRT
jgi:hypothetical protein